VISNSDQGKGKKLQRAQNVRNMDFMGTRRADNRTDRGEKELANLKFFGKLRGGIHRPAMVYDPVDRGECGLKKKQCFFDKTSQEGGGWVPPGTGSESPGEHGKKKSPTTPKRRRDHFRGKF